MGTKVNTYTTTALHDISQVQTTFFWLHVRNCYHLQFLSLFFIANYKPNPVP